MDNPILADQLADYENKWVAISEQDEKIVGSGTNALEAKSDAERGGYRDVILFKVPRFDIGYAERLCDFLTQNSDLPCRAESG